MLAKKREEERQIAVEYHCKSFTVSRRIHCITKAWLDMIPLINPWSSTFFCTTPPACNSYLLNHSNHGIVALQWLLTGYSFKRTYGIPNIYTCYVYIYIMYVCMYVRIYVCMYGMYVWYVCMVCMYGRYVW